MAYKCAMVSQNCMDLQKHAPGPCSETFAASSHVANQVMNVKVEEVSDVEVDEEHPVPMTFIGIKAEHGVSCMSVYPLLGRFHTRPYLPVVSLINICLSILLWLFDFEESFLICLDWIVSLHIACCVPCAHCLKEICLKQHLE
jgi:hypothetical protein